MKAFQYMIDLILPPRCIVSGEIVDQQGMLSPDAWGELNFITDPQCNRCGIPFDFDIGDVHEGSICAGCLKSPPLFDKARSAVIYDDASRDIILSFKHGDQTHIVPSFMPWLQQTGAEILDGTDFIVPVPLHSWRMLRRRFNQSALISQYLSQEVKVSVLLGGLKRRRSTPTQGDLNFNQRQKNVKNAFIVDPKYKAQINGKTILLIDDVYTTGATVNECTKILLKAGAASVNILTVARVVKPQRV